MKWCCRRSCARPDHISRHVAIGLASVFGSSQDKRATVINSKPEDADANTLSILCRPGLSLGSDDPELVQRECSILAWPDRTNQHRLPRLHNHQGASAKPLPVDTGQRLLRPPMRRLAAVRASCEVPAIGHLGAVRYSRSGMAGFGRSVEQSAPTLAAE